MRVLIVNRHILDVAGGSETQCHEIASELARMGHDVSYAVCQPERDAYEVPYDAYPLHGPFNRAFRAVLEEAAPEIVYWRYNKRHLLRSVLSSRRNGCRFVFAVSHINDVRPFATKPYYSAGLFTLQRALRSLKRLWTSLVGAVNHLGWHWTDGAIFQHAGQVPKGLRRPHVVIYNSYPVVDAAPPDTRAPNILWVANIKKSTHPELFVRLAQNLQDTGVEFWMVGDIQDSAYRRLLSDTDALPANFNYVGFQDSTSVNSLIRGSLFLAHTCDAEGFPNVFIQAWLQHKGVVSLYFDPGKLLSTQRIGFCSGDFATFCEDVRRLIEDTDLRESTGERAFQFALQHCNRQSNIKQLEAFLSQIIAGRR